MKADVWTKTDQDRRAFIGGSDARIIMGDDEGALVRLWREKRGEVEPEVTCPATSSISSGW
jgi:predicted phage-related endonuclease